jgi:hypothetical protein
MARVVYQGRIDGAFEGFNADRLFKMANGSYWIQAQYRYWYKYAYRPEVVITQEGSRHVLTVAGQSIPVRRVTDVIESQIDGTFEGWTGDSVYKLANGQVWQQSTYKYEYKYAYRPQVVIYSPGGPYVMHVEGTEAEVRRVK